MSSNRNKYSADKKAKVVLTFPRKLDPYFLGNMAFSGKSQLSSGIQKTMADF